MIKNIAGPSAPVARLTGVILRYGKTFVLNGINLEIPSARMIGLIGPDGVGKSSLMALVAGSRAVQQGRVEVLGGDMANARHRNAVCPNIAYMPQGLGRNLYPALSIEENLQFFGRLFGHNASERRLRIDVLTTAIGLYPFLDRPVGKLSGGMKQKLGLCCALIHDPELLILDEPTTGVDPLARSQFWDLIAGIRRDRQGMSVIVATAYMEEADRCDYIIAMDSGRILASGTPKELHERTHTDSLEKAFIALLPEERKHDYRPVSIPPLNNIGREEEVAIEAKNLTMRFGDFTAVDHVSFRIRRGEIFGFIGSNGCGKTTTMKILTGLLPPSEGNAWLFGHPVDARDITTRRRVGYMSQSFSLYSELTVRQNLVLHARLFNVQEEVIPQRVDDIVKKFGLADVLGELPEKLPLGIRQRLSLAVAMVHKPELLILDEPTSGVDPIARDSFWQLMIDLARNEKVTIFISTHFMNEAERCDRISLMHAGRVLASGAPCDLIAQRGVSKLEQSFIGYLEESGAKGEYAIPNKKTPTVPLIKAPTSFQKIFQRNTSIFGFSSGRAFSYTFKETLELRRDPVRATLALLGSLILMFIMGYGISMDVENLKYAVLDRDQTTWSQNYILSLTGSRYFMEQPPITDYADLDRRMRNGEISLALEIPPGFAADVKRGTPVQVGAWIDGSMPSRAEIVKGYVQGMHQNWLTDMAKHRLGAEGNGPASVETRFRYNPDVRSLPAMVPVVIPLLLLMIPSMLTALAVVREKELGSIINFYVTPVTRAEFLVGKQLPYIGLGMLNFFLLVLSAITVFGVPMKGSFLTLSLASLFFIIISTGFGLFISIFMRSQIAAMFASMLATMLPAVEFSGLLNPVSSLEGAGKLIGQIYPATHMFTISRGVFSKALGLGDLQSSFILLGMAVPVIIGASIGLLRKQEK